MVAGFVIQAGDPLGTGEGGPGYKVEEAPPGDLTYGKGVVAMAKTETEPPGTSGSQFFVVTADDAQLPPDYALLGRVTRGMDVVERIGAVETDAGDVPAARSSSARSDRDAAGTGEPRRYRALEFEQRALERGPAAVGPDAAAARHHAVAGHDDRHGVARARGADRAGGLGMPAARGQRPVGDDLAADDVAVQRLEHLAAERRAYEPRSTGRSRRSSSPAK